MNKNKKRISWLLLIGWMLMIFIMSHQSADISTSQSDSVLKFFKVIGIELNSGPGQIGSFIVRKSAHFLEYMILFLLSYNVSRNYATNKKSKLLLLVFVFLYACTDELHQYFIPGRSMAFKDVLIDTSGGGIGYVITIIFNKLKVKEVKLE